MRRVVLQQLAKIDQAECVELVRPMLEEIPKDVDEPYWTSPAANYTHVVMQLEDDGIWNDYLRIARRSAVGLRMEMMNPMNYSYIGDKNRERRLAFLAAFLDDTTVRDPSVKAGRYAGPCAAFTFGRIEVRDFVAMKIASLLDYDDRPTEFWTKQQWEELRTKVREGLAGEKLPEFE